MPASGTCDTSTPLKILMTADAVGGVWQYSLDLISHLANRGAKVLLATMGPQPDDIRKQHLATLPNVTLCESDYKLEWMQEPWQDVDHAGAWLLDLAAQFQPDVIHLNGYVHAALPWNAPVVVVAHSCVYSWWQAVHGTAPPAHEWTEYHRRVATGLHAADAVIAPSVFMADALAVHYGLPAARTQVIHNFSESPLYHGCEKEPFFLASGRSWDVGKNFQILDRVGDSLPWPIRVAASLPHESLLNEMQRASIYVHPALYEPFGLSVLEAARSQCCLVLSDIPSLRELWKGDAIFVDPRNPEEWIRVLNHLASDFAERESLGRCACIRAGCYSSFAPVEQYWRIYQSLSVRDRVAA